MAATSIKSRLRPDGGVPLAVGDVLALSAFVGYGLAAHSIDPLEFPLHAARTAAPFLLGWLAVAPFFGLYRPRTVRSARSTALRITLAWAVATLLGGAIRATDVFPGESPPVFLLVNFAFGLAFLLAWRLAVVWIGRP